MKDAGESFNKRKCLKQAVELFAGLLNREREEFGESHPATVSTARMLESCRSQCNGVTFDLEGGGKNRKGSVGTRFRQYSPAGNTDSSPGISQYVDDSSLDISSFISPQKNNQGGNRGNKLHNDLSTPIALEKQMLESNDSIPISPIALIEQNSPERTGYENEFDENGDKSWFINKGVGFDFAANESEYFPGAIDVDGDVGGGN